MHLGKRDHAMWGRGQRRGLPFASRSCLPRSEQGEKSQQTPDTQHTALCCPCRTFGPRLGLPSVQQPPFPTIPASRQVGTRARPTRRGKQVPGSLRAWHQGKCLGSCLAAGPLLPALEPESAPELGQSSMGPAADDAQSPPGPAGPVWPGAHPAPGL